MLTVQRSGTADLALIVMLGVLLPVTVANAGDRAFSAEDAAYIDWAYSNCQIVSSEKERKLASLASSRGGDTFVKAYELQFKKLATAGQTGEARQAACEQIKSWYGPAGSRIAELLIDKKTDPVVTTRPTPQPVRPPNGGGASRGS